MVVADNYVLYPKWTYTEKLASLLTDVPYQPTLREAILEECNSVNLTWGPPTREALGDPVTSYLPQIRQSGSEKPWMNSTSLTYQQSTSCLFPHLKEYTDYEVRVLAKNKVGYSLPSEILKVSTKKPGIFVARTDTLLSNTGV